MPEKYKFGLTVDEYVESLEAQRNALSAENQKLWERIKEMQAKINKVAALQEIPRENTFEPNYQDGYNECLQGVKHILR